MAAASQTFPSLTYGLLGEHLAHSHSPELHELLGSTPYEIVELPPEEVEPFLAARPFRGINVTIPYKKVAAAACDELSEVAARLGNANTLVVRPDGTLFGDNTDHHGFSCLLASTGVGCAGRCALVLGDGGAASTVRAVLADRGAAEILTASRKGPLTFERLRDESDEEAASIRERVSVIVNATPVGTYPHADDEPLVDVAAFPQLAAVCDLVYNPISTRLVQAARERGIPAVGGLAMLVAQAKRSSDLFLDESRPDTVEQELFATMLERLSCVCLIGMPGSGKTHTGRALAKELGYKFLDVDDMVAEAAGMPIDELITTQGEDAFRALESQCTAQATAQPQRVVACGGGVVTRPCNRDLIHQNGPVILLTRGLDASDGEDLPTDGRPLSQAYGLDRLRAERADLYHAWADIEIGPSESPVQTAHRCAVALDAYIRHTARRLR